MIQETGPIITGDMERLGAFLRSLPDTDRIFGYVLDSPGGDVLEAEKLANFVRRINTTVGVLRGAKCASACFLVFAAAPRKLAAPDALIGVHSASDAAGDETLNSLATTTLMSRDLAGFGVPSAIIGKVVTTEPDRMEWLMPSDLALLGVEMIAPRALATQRYPTGPTASAVGTTRQTTAQPTSAFDQGLADRRQWETWFSSLSGSYREGALFSSAQRSLLTRDRATPAIGRRVAWRPRSCSRRLMFAARPSRITGWGGTATDGARGLASYQYFRDHPDAIGPMERAGVLRGQSPVPPFRGPAPCGDWSFTNPRLPISPIPTHPRPARRTHTIRSASNCRARGRRDD